MKDVVLEVIPPDPPNGPKWDIGLEDKSIDVEDPLVYPVEFIETPSGLEKLVTIDLGTAKGFMKWDEEADAFVVEEGAAKDEFVGEHLICMNVAYFNETYRDEYEDCFTLTIKANATVAENEE